MAWPQTLADWRYDGRVSAAILAPVCQGRSVQTGGSMLGMLVHLMFFLPLPAAANWASSVGLLLGSKNPQIFYNFGPFLHFMPWT